MFFGNKRNSEKNSNIHNNLNQSFNKEPNNIFQNVNQINNNVNNRNQIVFNQPNNINQINNINQNNNNNFQNLNRNNSLNNIRNELNELDNIDINIEVKEDTEEDEKEDKEKNAIDYKKILDEKLIKKKCSLKEHSEDDAIIFCQECKIYMCNKCEKTHNGLLKNHHLLNLNKNGEEIFTGICPEKNHFMELEYFCRTHNQLCCAACIAKIKSKGNGKHKNCKVFGLLKIKDKKKNLLEENMNKLNELSNKLEPSIDELKKIYEIINDKKEKLKVKIQKLFTEIRNALNEREDLLLLDVDKKFDEYFFNEEFIRKSEKLPKLVKISLEKGKINEKEWEDENTLNKLINNCIIIENNIENINLVYSKIDSYKTKKDSEFELEPKRDETNEFLENIKSYGKIKLIEINNINKKEIIEFNQIENMPILESNNNDVVPHPLYNNNLINENNN